MNEISNKTLAILVILAIIVSLVGLFIGRARIVTVGKVPTVPGEVRATVETQIDISIEGTPMDFGTVIAGDRISSESDCLLDPDCTTEVGNTWDTVGCAYDAVPSPTETECNKVMPLASNNYLTITSLGLTQTDVQYVASKSLFCNKWGAAFTPGAPNEVVPASGDRQEEDQSFQAKVKVTASSSPCDIGFTGITGQPFTEMTFKNVDLATDQKIARGCSQNDLLDIYFKIMVPTNEPAGTPTSGLCLHTTTLTFTGTPT